MFRKDNTKIKIDICSNIEKEGSQMSRYHKYVVFVVLGVMLLTACQPAAPAATEAPKPPAPAATQAPAAPAPTKAPAAPAATEAPKAEVKPTDAPAAGVKMMDTAKYKKPAPWTFCFSNASVSNSWRVSLVGHVDYQINELRKQGKVKDYFKTDANDDPNKQIADTEDLLTKGCDILLISAATAEALTPVAEKAMDKGIPVVTFDRNIASDKYVTFVESNACEMGRMQAKFLVDKLNGKGNVALLSGTAGSSAAEDPLRCAQEEFAKAPGIKVLENAYTDWSPVKGKQIMEAWITKYPQIDGVWADSGLQSSGAVEAFMDAGMKVPPVTGEDYNGYLKMWKKIGFDGVAVSFSSRIGSETVKLAADILDGKPVPHYFSVPSLVITKDNLKQYVRDDLSDDYYADALPEVLATMFPAGGAPTATPAP
jgi:ribose transport system substrate-binding protein